MMRLRWTLLLATAVLPLLAPAEDVGRATHKLDGMEGKMKDVKSPKIDRAKLASIAGPLADALGSLAESIKSLKSEVAIGSSAEQQGQPSKQENVVSEKDAPELPPEPQMTQDQAKALHTKMDGNGDGKVSMREVMEFSKIVREDISKKDAHDNFEDLDINGDGKIETSEFLEMLSNAGEDPQDEIHAQKFKSADENGNGHLDHGELHSVLFPETHDAVFQQHASAVFKKKDVDGDGALSIKEFWHLDGTEDEHTMSKLSEDFEQLDADHNDKLDLNEMKHWESGSFQLAQAMQHLFEAADENEDGEITISELQEACTTIAGSPVESYLLQWAAHHEL